MSVVYEPRSFMPDGAYPPIGDEHDHGADQRFTDSDVAEQLSHYTNEALLADERAALDDRAAMSERVVLDERHVLDEEALLRDDTTDHDASRLDLDDTRFPSPIHVALEAAQIPDGQPESKDSSPAAGSPLSTRMKNLPKPDRPQVPKAADGKFHCTVDDCKEEVRAFHRRCEWNKHMDKHERPYRCIVPGCESLPGFTYSGGLLRHEREVHGKYGGPKNTVKCPHPNCKRHTGKGFSRQENLNEHLRRVHTNMEGASPQTDAAHSADDNDSERSGMKRKRRYSGSEEVLELREELKRMRDENEKLKIEMEAQNEHSLSMMQQIAELQDALRHGISTGPLGAPTAQMI